MEDALAILESLTASQFFPIRTKLNKREKALVSQHLRSPHLLDPDNNTPGWIWIPRSDRKSKYLIPFIAHEIGHYIDWRTLSKKNERELMFSLLLSQIFSVPETIVIEAEVRAWKYGEYILRTLGIFDEKMKKKFNKAKKYCLASHRGKPYIPESKWK